MIRVSVLFFTVLLGVSQSFAVTFTLPKGDSPSTLDLYIYYDFSLLGLGTSLINAQVLDDTDELSLERKSYRWHQ
jgi:hypothetical protein